MLGPAARFSVIYQTMRSPLVVSAVRPRVSAPVSLSVRRMLCHQSRGALEKRARGEMMANLWRRQRERAKKVKYLDTLLLADIIDP